MDWTPTKPRGPIAASFSGPGPSVMLPSCLGQRTSINKKMNPIYSFGIRHCKLFDDCSPGPCYAMNSRVSRKGHTGEPHYSLYGRPKDIKPFRTPGPGAYSPEKAGQSAHYHAPSYSLSSRTHGIKFDKSPAPNSYSLPSILGGRSCAKESLPVYSMTGRSKIGGFDEDLQKTPGPGSYAVVNPNVNKNKGPLYSMTARNTMPSDSTRKPGPGQHCPERVVINKKKAPVYSFGIKHSEYTTPLINEPSE
ncbi:ciliary microtubule associated protein 1A-like [Diadema antillarum]|uniref:ciliary microtubule associated protein 1A-like n=1 Tax=Diadema antillarum TaxID=105358 RepID=UPI003A83B09A